MPGIKEKKKTEEVAPAELAKLLDKLGDFLGDGDEIPSVTELTARLTSLEEKLPAGMNAGDLERTLTEFDKLKESQRTMRERIRTSRSGAYVPGLEDATEKFSLTRALSGMFRSKSKDWSDVGAGFEKEVLDGVREKAAQSVGDDSLGGYFVPDQVIPDVIEAIYTNTVFISLDGEGGTLASVIAGLSGGTVTVPKFDGGTQAYWIGEQDAYTASNATVGDITMNPKKLGVLVKITDSMQRFGGYGFDGLLRRDITKAASTKLDYTVLYGAGDKAPRGLVKNEDLWVYSQKNGTAVKNTTAGLATLTWSSPGELFHFDDLMTMDLLLEEDDIQADASYHTVMPPRANLNLKQLRAPNFSGAGATESPYLSGRPMMTDAMVAELIGPFSKLNQIPTGQTQGASVGATASSAASKHSDVLRGNMSEIVIGRWGGIEIEDDRGLSNFTTDHILLKLRLYADINVRQPRKLMLCPDAQTSL